MCPIFKFQYLRVFSSLDNPVLLWESPLEPYCSSNLLTDGAILTVYTHCVDASVFSYTDTFSFARFDSRSLRKIASFRVANESPRRSLPTRLEAHVAMTGNDSVRVEVERILKDTLFQCDYTDSRGNTLFTFVDAIKKKHFVVFDRNMHKIADRIFPTRGTGGCTEC
jgi:hypothetical protein